LHHSKITSCIALLAGICFADTIPLAVGSSFQDSVIKYPAGTVFKIAAGIHRMQSVQPKNGDIFLGDSWAIMSGAKVLDSA